MNLWTAILLGIIQGLTEFLPISSTAHLTAAEFLFLGKGMPLLFDVLLHVGTLLALGVYYRSTLRDLLDGFMGRSEAGRSLLKILSLAMIPTIILGLATRGIKDWAKDHLWVYGLGLLLTALLLYVANDKAQKQQPNPAGPLRLPKAKAALWVGAIQGLFGGLGVSRSGSTIAMGTFRGLTLQEATRFSFLLAIPTIAAAALFEIGKLITGKISLAEALGQTPSTWLGFFCFVGIMASFISGYFSIQFLDRLLQKPKLNGFAFYCLCIGFVLLIFGTVGWEGFTNFGIPHR